MASVVPNPASPPAPFSLRSIALGAFGPTVLFGIGEGAILPVVPLTARDLGASVPTAALIVTLIGIGSLVSNIPASLITMKRGERWAIVAAAIWSIAALAMCALTGHLGLFALGAFMVGMSQAVYSLARQSYMTEAVPPEHRARALSTLGGSMRVGLFIGPFLAAAAIHRCGIGAAYAVGIVALIAAALLGARMPDLVHHTPPPAAGEALIQPSLRGIVGRHRRLFYTLGLGVMLISAVRTTRQAVIPLWADHLALAPSVAALIYGIAGGVEMLVFYPAGRVMDRKGRLWVAIPSLLTMAVPLLLMPFTSGSHTLLLAAAVVGFGNGIGSGLIMTLGADYSPRHGRAHFLGVWRLMADLGSTAGPALLSFLAASISLGAGIAATGALALLAAAQLAYWVPRTTRSPH